MKNQRGFTLMDLLMFVWVVVVLLGVGGWIANIVKFIGMDVGTATAMLMLRAIGIIAAPLGAVLGYL